MEEKVMNVVETAGNVVDGVVKSSKHSVVLGTVAAFAVITGVAYVGKTKLIPAIKTRFKGAEEEELEDLDNLYVEDEDAEKIANYIKSKED